MSILSLRPYAAKAIIEHDWQPNTLTIWLTFRFPMDQTVKPANAKWLLTIDGVPGAAATSTWLDTFTLQLTRGFVFALPTTVTVEYDGPGPSLRTTWLKQWEPWAPITSVYLLSVRGQTTIGGFASRLINKTGAVTVAGDVVKTDAANTDAVILTPASDLNAVGVFLDSGIVDGSLAWVVNGGVADIHMDAGGCAAGDRIITSITPGRGQVNNAPSVAIHFQEIGHAQENAVANANARCMIHFL